MDLHVDIVRQKFTHRALGQALHISHVSAANVAKFISQHKEHSNIDLLQAMIMNPQLQAITSTLIASEWSNIDMNGVPIQQILVQLPQHTDRASRVRKQKHRQKTIDQN